MPTDEKIASESSTEVQETGIDLADLSAEQYDAFMLNGTLPEAKPAEIAPQPPKTIETPEESGKSKGNQEAGKGKGVKERNAQLDGEIQELEARLARKADLKRQLESDTGDKPGTPPAETKPAELKAPVKPKVDDFKTWDEYETARDKFFEDLSDYKVAKAIQEDRAQRAEEAKKQQQEAEGKQAAEKWNKQVATAAKEHSDWDEVIKPVSELVGKDPRFQAGASFLLESEVGAEILYHLGSNPDEAREIAAMSPIRQVAALTRIELSLTKPAQSVKTPPGPKKVTEAPPPPSDLNGRNQLAPDPIAAALEADDTEAYMQLQNAKDLADIAAGKRRR